MSWTSRDGVLESPLLRSAGFVAGFTARALGAMAGARVPEGVAAANRAALARRLGFDGVCRIEQVHGRGVVRLDEPRERWPVADAVWSARPGALLGVSAADCVPVLVGEPGGVYGAAHAGWGGTVLRVSEALVDALVAAGARPERLVAALGPSIGPCCYTIDPVRASVIRGILGNEFVVDPVSRRPAAPAGRVPRSMDLWSANEAQLRARGVRDLEVSAICTQCGGADLWSSRAAQGRHEGLGLGFIGRRA